jgi:hypothetical protein
MTMSHDRRKSGMGAVLENLPPAHEITCTHCGRSFALRARLTQAIHIRCAGCGRLFMAQAAGAAAAEKAEGADPKTETEESPQRRSKPAKTPGSSLRNRIALGAGVVATAFVFGLLWPSIFPDRIRHQWDVEVGVGGGKKATFALWGISEDRIQSVYSSFDGGPLSVDSNWTCHRDEARMLSADNAKGGFPLGVEFARAGVPWEIRFCGEGRARIESGGKVFTGTVARTAVQP